MRSGSVRHDAFPTINARPTGRVTGRLTPDITNGSLARRLAGLILSARTLSTLHGLRQAGCLRRGQVHNSPCEARCNLRSAVSLTFVPLCDSAVRDGAENTDFPACLDSLAGDLY